MMIGIYLCLDWFLSLRQVSFYNLGVDISVLNGRVEGREGGREGGRD